MDFLSLYDPSRRDRTYDEPDPAAPQLFRTREHRIDVYTARQGKCAIFNPFDEDVSNHDRLGLRGQKRADNGTDLPTDTYSIEQMAEEADAAAAELPPGWMQAEIDQWVKRFHRPRSAAA